MTLEQFSIKLKQLGVSKKQAAEDIGYSKDHFLRVMNRKVPMTRKFLDDLNYYIEIRLKDFKGYDMCIDDFDMTNEANMPHNNEFQKLKQTMLYKTLMN